MRTKWKIYAASKVSPSIHTESPTTAIYYDTTDCLLMIGVPLTRDEEVQGQVTQMRFSLTLMLHQMEVGLYERDVGMKSEMWE